MENQKLIDVLDNTPNQPTICRTKNSVKINDVACGTYNTNGQIKSKTLMLKSSSSNCSDAYILVSGTITFAALATGGRSNGVEVIFKNCAPFTDCIIEINNTQIDKARNINVVMPMYSLIEYSDNYSRTGS